MHNDVQETEMRNLLDLGIKAFVDARLAFHKFAAKVFHSRSDRQYFWQISLNESRSGGGVSVLTFQ